jgi:hypothetical protein
MANTYFPKTTLGLQPNELEVLWRTHENGRFQTQAELFHISNPASGDLTNSTQALAFVNFNITNAPNAISGLSIRVQTQRNGRATDQQIQLTYQGQPIGINNVNYITDEEGHLFLNNDVTYGSSTSTWGVSLTPEMVQDPSFGVILKFQAHPYYPHSSGMFIDSVALTVY